MFKRKLNDAQQHRRPRAELRDQTLDAARHIIATDGLRGLTARRLADACGYAVGTLYNLFETTDALIAELNLETLNALEAALDRQPPPEGSSPEAAVLHVARAALDFTSDHRQRWAAVLEFVPAAPHAYQAATTAVVDRLIRHLEDAMGKLGAGLPAQECRMAAAVLWAGFEGIVGLTAANSIATVSRADAWSMIRYLVATCLAGIERGAQASRHGRSRAAARPDGSPRRRRPA
jgi:AcrR family transcriptional regulator